MRYLALAGLLLALGLAGCDSGQESPRPVTPPEIQDQPAETEPAQPEPDPDEGEPELVEESAAVDEQERAEEKSLMLAKAETAEPAGDWQFEEGRHFQRLVPTQPTIGDADKVEVAEVFWYGCSHCYDFEPFINRWIDDMPANARFVRIPATWNRDVKLHAQLYYTAQVLAKTGKLEDPEAFHTAVFNEYHRRGNKLRSVDAIQSLFERHGVSEEDFRATWDKSFEVDQKLRLADSLARRYGITGVPTIVVNGKYRTGASDAGGYPELLDVIDELIARETVR